jgi:DNA-binding beta-propeller fold protein YncE
LDNPDPSQPLVIITDSEIDQKNLLPAGWTGTDEMTYLDPNRRRFAVRYGLYRYRKLVIYKVPEAIPAGLPNMDLSEPAVTAFQGGHGRRKGEFDNPRAIAVDSAGNIYVADTNNNRVQKFFPKRNFRYADRTI